eukprot:5716635-Prorocentrum_lima.AAC.1
MMLDPHTPECCSALVTTPCVDVTLAFIFECCDDIILALLSQGQGLHTHTHTHAHTVHNHVPWWSTPANLLRGYPVA